MNQVVLLRGGSVEVQPISELPAIAFKHEGVFMGSPDWWRRFEYLEDRRLGNAFQEDMWTPGAFELVLEPNRTAYLVTAVGAPPGARVLEVATGPGYVALGFGAAGCEVVGVDLTAAPLAGSPS